ncbi:MAG: hypothetical protein ACKO7W_24520 [Elainella sp.]
MKGSCLIDFYHDWSIEVEPKEQGFGAICYSPYRKRLVLDRSYASDVEALQAAKQKINEALARMALAAVVREFYETQQLSFEEWNSLHQNLTVA